MLPAFLPLLLATGSYANANGDARVPSVVIPMVRRIFPNLLAHKLVGVQPMTGPVGFAFAYRAKYDKFRNGNKDAKELDKEIGYLNAYADFTGNKQTLSGGAELTAGVASGYFGAGADSKQLGRPDPQSIVSGEAEAEDEGKVKQSQKAADAWKAFFGADSERSGNYIGAGADVATAENWGIGTDMPAAKFEFLKATVEAKTRKLGAKITRETEEDMKAMQGMSAMNEMSDILSYEISQEIDRQLLGEIVQAAVRAGHVTTWKPAAADGQNQTDRINGLYTTILTASANIAKYSRRGAANWAVASPGAAALLESHIYNPLGVGGGLGNANAFGKDMDNNIGVVEIGTLRNGTIKLYRDTLAGGEYILMGYKGNNVYDSGVIYLPYIPLELMPDVDPFTMNPVVAARTRYGVTTNLFGAGEFYHMINMNAIYDEIETGKSFVQF